MNVQDFIVFALVTGAVAYLVRNWWGASRKSGGGCGGCAGACGKPTTKAEPQLVQISLNGSSFKGTPLNVSTFNGAASRPSAHTPSPRPKA